MNVLKFYISKPNTSISHTLVQYLVDAGHQVIISELPSESLRKIVSSAAHNLIVVESLDSLKDKKIDAIYPPMANVQGQFYPQLDINIIQSDTSFRFESNLVREGQCFEYKGLEQNIAEENLLLDDYFSVLENALENHLIDTVIALSRNSLTLQSLIEPPKANGQLQDFIDEIHNHQELKESSTKREDYFSGQREIVGKREQVSLSLNNYGNLNSEEDWLIACLLLQGLMNARKEGVYGLQVDGLEHFYALSHNDVYQTLHANVQKNKNNLLFSRCKQWLVKNSSGTDCLMGFTSTKQEDCFDGILVSKDKHLVEIYFDTIHEVLKEAPLLFSQLNNNWQAFRAGRLTVKEILQQLCGNAKEAHSVLNDTVIDPAWPCGIICSFEQQVKNTPNKIALSDNEKTYTYRKLNEKASRLAARLNESNSKIKEQHVLVLLDRSDALIITLLALMKLEAVYLPVDQKYPDSRLQYIINDSEPELIITSKSQAARFEKLKSKNTVIEIEDEIIASNDFEKEKFLSTRPNKESLAYIIYTSGTTGNPKGTMISNEAIANLVNHYKTTLRVSHKDNLLSVTTIAFDIAELEVFVPLISGANLVLAKEAEVLEPRLLLKKIVDEKISLMQATPSLWQLVLPLARGEFKNITALCGGEPLSAKVATLLAEKAKQYFNVYGPTETTVWSTQFLGQAQSKTNCIGKPIANTNCYILDKDETLLPAGVIGDLYIGGRGVARGYLNQEDLTKDRFKLLPGLSHNNQRIYQTGDQALLSSDGNLYFYGRDDSQVKIRGHRIELSDINNHLLTHSKIKQSVVVVKTLDEDVKEDEEKQIVAYYCSDETLSLEELKAWLAQKLPPYMIPSFFVTLTSLPLTVNGKIDVKSLPKPTLNTLELKEPQDPFEEALCKIWYQELKVNGRTFNLKDDFFNLGGNSITAIKLVNRINSQFNANINIIDLFKLKTLEALLPIIKQSKGSFLYKDYVISNLDLDNRFQPFSKTNVQQTYYLGRYSHFELSNVSTHVYTEFVYEHLEHDRLEKAFNRLLRRHDALRTVFSDNSQRFLEEVPYYKINSNQESYLSCRERLSHKLYDPATYPLFDIEVSKHNDKTILHLSFDAIIIDMSSFEILFKEWIELYQTPSLTLPHLALSYRDYVKQLEVVREGRIWQSYKEYWLPKLEEFSFEMNLPLKLKPSQVTKPHFERITNTISAPIWKKIKEKAQKFGLSPTSVILNAFANTLCFWTGQTTLSINLTLFNRLPLHKDVDKLIGDFTVLSLFSYQKESKLSIANGLTLTHQRLMDDFAHNLFDGMDVQRLVRQKGLVNKTQILSPVVLTSVLGDSDGASLFHLPLDTSYQGHHYSISQTSQVWLDHKAFESNGAFVAEWDYVSQLFDKDFIQAMHKWYVSFIENLALIDWQKEADELVPETPEETYQVVNHANNMIAPTSEETLVSLFEKAVCLHPENNAIFDAENNEHYKFKDLQRYLKAASHALYKEITNKAYKKSLIAVLCDKGMHQWLSCMSIMSSNKAYLPLHVDWPLSRIEEVLEQGDCHWVITDEKTKERLEIKEGIGSAIEIITVESLLNNPECKFTRPMPKPSADNLAYVIFTSGSTGKPKGVTINHRGAVNTINAVNKRFSVDEKDKIFSLSELSFDLSVYDLFGSITKGAETIIPIQSKTKEPSHWVELIKEHGVTLWNSVPQLGSLLCSEANGSELASLRLALLSGDNIPLNLPDKLKRLSKQIQVISLGGATEGSIWSIWHEIVKVEEGQTRIPYGVAMPNQRMYVLNEQGHHCPIGVTGEIHIGGTGLALNYWANEQATNRQFFVHPKLGRLYRTGDLGCWDKRGHIEFLGRCDFQVKVNGYRVECDEIATKLTDLNGIKQAVVIANKVGEGNQLVAYVEEESSAKKQSFDELEFKQKQLSLQKFDSVSTITFDTALDESKYRHRKSYRNFIDATIKDEAVWSVLNQGDRALTSNNKLEFGAKKVIEQVVAPLFATKLGGRLLTKYRYPSGGSTYSVRSYLSIAKDGELSRGCYYLNPVEKVMYKINDQPIENEDAIHFVSYLPAISPLYGEGSERLACIEAGEMMGLVFDELNELEMKASIEESKRNFSRDELAIAKIVIGKQQDSAWITKPSINLLQNNNGLYKTINNGKDYDASILPLGSESSAFGQMLLQGQYLVSIEGERGKRQWCASGFYANRFVRQFNQQKIASCPMGFTPFSDSLYTLLLGSVKEDEWERAESKAPLVNKAELVRKKISKQLPDYMVPKHLLFISEIPLSANGKVDRARLPKVELKEEQHKPETSLEKELAELVALILKGDEKELCTKKSFFELGGDSLTAMRLVQQLKKRFSLDLKLSDLYKESSVKKLALLKQEQCEVEVEEEEGVL